MRSAVLMCLMMVLLIGTVGCPQNKSSSQEDSNAPVAKKSAKDRPQLQEKYGFAPIGE